MKTYLQNIAQVIKLLKVLAPELWFSTFFVPQGSHTFLRIILHTFSILN